MSNENGKPTPKALALEALREATTEAERAFVRPPVLIALLEIAKTRLEAVEELKHKRPKPKVTPPAKESAA